MNIENRQSFLWLAVLCIGYGGLFGGYKRKGARP